MPKTIIDTVDVFKKRQMLHKYINLLKLANMRAKSIKDNPEPHIYSLCEEVERLRMFLQRIDEAAYPPLDFTDSGNVKYPEPLNIELELANKFNGMLKILEEYRLSNPIRYMGDEF